MLYEKKRSLRIITIILFILILMSNTASASALSTGWASKTEYRFQSTNQKTKIYVQTLTNAGDSSLISIDTIKSTGTERKRILIDAGSYGDSVAKALVAKKATNIDIAIITHNDSDHLNGLMKFASNNIKIKDLYYNYNYSRTNPRNAKIPDALTFVKGLKNKVVTNRAIRIRDVERHSGAEWNVNMESGNKEYLKICRGRLLKLWSTSASNGYDLTIVPPLTDRASNSYTDTKQDAYWQNNWTINNTSMMVVLETAKDKVIFGGDIQEAATFHINNYKSNVSIIPKTPSDTYSYYYAVNKLLFYNSQNPKYTVYKVSHHGTGAGRSLLNPSIPQTGQWERIFLDNIKPDALVLNGGGSVKVDKSYYNNIYPQTKNANYIVFGNQKL